MALLPVRSFDGIDDHIRCLPGSTDITGAWSVAALIRQAVSSWQTICQGHDASGRAHGYLFETDTRWRLGMYGSGGGSTDVFSPDNFIPSAAWTIVAVTKADGSAYPDFHAYDFASRTWGTGRGGSQILNTESFGADGHMHFGTYEGRYRYRGEMAAVAMWDVALSAPTVGQLATVPALAQWAGVGSPRALWLFDQTDVETDVLDLVGGAYEHDHAGTTVVHTELPIPYRASGAAVHDGSAWVDRSLLVHSGADWTNPTSVGVL